MNRRLTLKSESIAPLADAELESVVGGKVPTFPVNECTTISWEFTCFDCITRRDCRP